MPQLRHLLSLIFLGLILPMGLIAAPRDAEIERRLNRGGAAQALWGVYAIDYATGEVLADINGDKLFVPASNRKIVTGAMVAAYMKADETLTTEVSVTNSPQGGVVNGDLVVHASGDPSWTASLRSGRLGSVVLRDIARQVHASGVTTVRGDLVIDTSLYDEPAPVPPGWNWEDFQTIYGSIPSVFGTDSNLGRVVVAPGRSGEPIRVSFTGAVAPFTVNNASQTGRAGSAPTLQINRGLDGVALTLTGSMAADAPEQSRAMPLGRPVEITAQALWSELTNAAVTIDGAIRVTPNATKGSTIVATVSSVPIAEILEEMEHESDNFLAESLYLITGAAVYGRGSYRASAAAEKRLWEKAGVKSSAYVSMDGSGLSRKNLVTPQALVALLDLMGQDELFVGGLPVSGKNGTMRYRLTESGLAGRVIAKTGTLDGVSALSGYIKANNRTIVFSVIANNYSSGHSSIRAAIDDVVEILAR